MTVTRVNDTGNFRRSVMQTDPALTTNPQIKPEPFRLTFARAYASFIDGQPPPVPYVVDGLLTQGGLSILAAKPKEGKSSLSRYLASCVAKGTPFLGRDTAQGDVILVNLEDPLMHVDNCLKVLGYEQVEGQGLIEITTRLSPDINETFNALRDAVAERPNLRLIVVDHLAKLLRLKDLNDYMLVQQGFQRLRDNCP
jgi:AAA domain